VEMGKDYAIVLSNNAGLWAYNLGDLVRFVSKEPYRIVVTGRVSQFISAFGEHVIASEVEGAMAEICANTGIRVDEFHVAPMVNPPEGGLPYHQWIVEFATPPPPEIATQLDQAMCYRNTYYNDLITGHVLQPLKIVTVPKGTFQRYMASQGRLGGQNKVPHLSDNREVADALLTSHLPNS